jgi:Xaa-Pro dipeptidase
MPLPIAAVQRALQEDRLDGWLLYDFHGSNPIASRLSGLANAGKLATRRWYYLVPATGEPRGLVHAIERHNLDGLPGDKRPYAGREQLSSGLRDLLRGMKRIAMEYSPGNAIPYVSRVDAGTVEAVRQLGIDVTSSGDLVQRFEAVWTDEAFATHQAAADRLYRIKDRAFELVRHRMRQSGPLNEYELQQSMLEWFSDEGLATSDPPSVSAHENAGFVPTRFCWSTSGVSFPSPAQSLLTSPGSASRGRPCPTNTRAHSRQFATGGMPPSISFKRR